MRTTAHRISPILIAVACAVFLLASLAAGQARDEYGDVQQTVARIASLDGSVSFARGDDPDNWQAADQNVPMTIGDRVYTGSRSRAELALEGGDSIRLGAQTDLAALNLTDDTKQFSVKGGVASFKIRQLADNEVFEIDTPNAALTVDRPGSYRVDVDQDGNTQVTVRNGHLTAAAGGGQVALQSGDEMDIDGIDSPTYDVVAARPVDAWDQWVAGRDGRFDHSRSLQYVSADVVGADDLDQYGRWQQVPDYGWVWSPTAVAADWVPYRAGHWIWQDPWGWTWVSSEPWGWAPYHYGRWVTSSSRWYWVPVAPSVRAVVYAPALVAFVGGGPGWGGSVSIGGGGFVGWFPLGPRDPANPWWGRRAANVNVTNVTYVNRTYVTVVNQNTFVSGAVVGNAIIRDQTVLRQVVAAPVARGPIPVVPTAASLRVAVRTNLPAPPRPSAQILARSVVARVAPPPAPPSFQAKVAVIRENHGAPVAAAQAAKISVESRGRAQAITNVRPVTAVSGKITLAPRGKAATSAAAHAEPISAAPARGRPLATAQQPVSASPVTSSTGPSHEKATAQTGQPIQSQPPSGRERLDHAGPPVEKNTPASTGAGTNVQGESWRSRQKPTPAPHNAMPLRSQPTPQPADKVGRGVAPQSDRPAEPTYRSRESGAQPTVHERFERPTPAGGRGGPQARPTQPPAREDHSVGEHQASPSTEGRPQTQAQPERQVERAAPTKVEKKKDDKGKEKPKPEDKKKDDRERKPD